MMNEVISILKQNNSHNFQEYGKREYFKDVEMQKE